MTGRVLLNTTLSPFTTTLLKQYIWPTTGPAAAPAELSILVHEMVHHFQNMLGLKYECPQAREALAYRAQDQWLGLFGRDLGDGF